MRFLIDADSPLSLIGLCEQYGHVASNIRLIGLGRAKDPEVAALAQAQQACLLTGDFGFADIRNYDPSEYYGIVVVSLPRRATASFIRILVEQLLQQPDVLIRLPGRLAILEPGAIRLRPS